MKATFNEIVKQLVKVLTNKAESAQYYSDNEQFICLCGWCGTMSPASRPAYYKTFGKDTTEAAEAKAREIIAEKEAARKRTKYAATPRPQRPSLPTRSRARLRQPTATAPTRPTRHPPRVWSS